jgi:hypothetical protein
LAAAWINLFTNLIVLAVYLVSVKRHFGTLIIQPRNLVLVQILRSKAGGGRRYLGA